MLTASAAAYAMDYLVSDFEDCAIGQTFTVWNSFGGSQPTTAVVEADPKNPANKVLHITNKGWNDHVEFELPAEFAGTNFSDKVETVSLKICRHQNDPCGEWKNFQIYLGDDKLHEESWPSYGPVSTWKTWTYTVPAVSAGNISPYLRLGFNSDNSDYYIDEIRLKGPDFTVYEDGELNFSDPSSTSSSYTRFDGGINIPAGTELNVYTSRYTYWLSPVRGGGRLNIHSGGERSYIGNNSGQLPDWEGFGGEVHIYPWPEVNTSVKAGFYGEILAHGGFKYDPGDVKASIKEGRFSQILARNKVVLHEGATLAGEDGNNARAHRFASLSTEAGSRIMGYYKGNKQKGVYYLVGSDGSDSELAGTIAAEGTSMVGIVKEGSGTYTLSANDNRITGLATVVGGKLLVSNDAAAAREQKLAGGIGLGDNITGVMVYTGGCLGGSGSISALTDVYGYLEPGDAKGNTLTLADFVGGKAIDLKLHPTSRLIFNVAGSGDAARLDVSGAVALNPRDEAWDLSGAMPILEIKLAETADLKAGDSFTLISAGGKSDADSQGWAFRVQYPKAYTWEVKEEATAEGYTVTATVTSTEYSGQGDTIIEDEPVLDGDNSAFIFDWTEDYDDPTPLRDYAARSGKNIGVAVPVWKFNLNNANDTKTRTTAEQFNLVVAENEMKIDATEPSQGNFNLGNANTLINFADRNGMDVRGHTLVWHQQVPGWISEDGKKNNHHWTKDQLLDIMRNHIDGVAGALKGKVREWDVVNECLDDDQSIVWSNPDGYKLRSSVWKDVIGEEFIAEAFRAAREADPDAVLYLNDYGVEFAGQPKAEAFYNLAKKLVEAGVPIDGVGLQCHLTTGQVDARKLKENIRRYNDLGLKCIITELDIAQANPGASDAALRQAEDYCAVVTAALSQENCPTVLIWGLVDPDSWRENNPLIYDGNVKPKEAYYGVHAALRTLAKRSGVEEIAADAAEAEVVAVEYYNLQGLRVGAGYKGLVVKVLIHADGSRTTAKAYLR
ncbi:MAG: endo-1,4-beta-xylanase [Muribaculaceae bacterium]|nr:endo-1,4-beta-xylanase [Muribaculaceae bacterium]